MASASSWSLETRQCRAWACLLSWALCAEAASDYQYHPQDFLCSPHKEAAHVQAPAASWHAQPGRDGYRSASFWNKPQPKCWGRIFCYRKNPENKMPWASQCNKIDCWKNQPWWLRMSNLSWNASWKLQPCKSSCSASATGVVQGNREASSLKPVFAQSGSTTDPCAHSLALHQQLTCSSVLI